MKKLLASLLFVLLTAGGGYAAELPWKTFSESVKDTVSAGFAGCPGAPEVLVVMVMLEKAGVGYVFAYVPETGRIAFVVYADGQRASEYGVGRVDLKTPGAHDIIPPLKWRPADSSLRDLCAHLVEHGARLR